MSRSTVPKSVDEDGEDGADRVDASKDRCWALINPPSHRIAARSSALRSSRTLPGQ